MSWHTPEETTFMRLNANDWLPCLYNSSCRSYVITAAHQPINKTQTFTLLQWLPCSSSQNRKFKHTPVITKNATCALVPNYQAMKVYRSNGGDAPHILNLGTRLMSVSSFMLYTKSPQETGWAPGVSLCMMTKREALYREPNPGCPARMSE